MTLLINQLTFIDTVIKVLDGFYNPNEQFDKW